MGGSYEESGSLLPQDLKVTIKESSLLVPSEESHKIRKKAMFLSNVDQVLNFDVQTVHFFRPNKEFPPEIVTEKLRKALVRAMDDDYYEFLAGRLRLNPSSGRLEVDCNGEGAGFVTATSEYTLEELGDLIFPNQAFAQLVASQLDQSLPKHDQPLCVFQITSFKCGGFAMGISTNHTTFDGISFKTFLENLASLLHEKPLSAPPCNDRTLLKARTPPRVTFPHHELVQFQDSDTTVFQATSEQLDFNIFKLSSQQIQKLKDKALETNNASGCVRVTGFNVVTALVWRCKALSFAQEEEEEDLEKESTILYAVDIRRRLNPQLPSSYTGNAVLTAYAKAKRKALLQEPFGRIVEMVGEGAMRVTDEYARSAIDWGELYKGFPHGEVLVSSWWKLGFEEVQYPWGKPKYSCPVVYHRKDIILLFPDIDADSKGVYVLAALPSKEMAKFQHWFQQTLS